jgi:hypothetical protein
VRLDRAFCGRSLELRRSTGQKEVTLRNAKFKNQKSHGSFRPHHTGPGGIARPEQQLFNARHMRDMHEKEAAGLSAAIHRV